MDKNRFEVVYKQGNGFSTWMRILRDRVTGVEYLLAGEGYGAGLTPLLNANGSPVVEPEANL